MGIMWLIAIGFEGVVLRVLNRQIKKRRKFVGVFLGFGGKNNVFEN